MDTNKKNELAQRLIDTFFIGVGDKKFIIGLGVEGVIDANEFFEDPVTTLLQELSNMKDYFNNQVDTDIKKVFEIQDQYGK